MSRVIAVVLVLGGFLGVSLGGDDTERKRTPRFTVGKETTRITGPLDNDGYIEYAAALNKLVGKGITPKNNAEVLLHSSPDAFPLASPNHHYKWKPLYQID